MTRKEAENRLLEMARQMNDFFKAYNPDGDRLGIWIIGDQINISGMYTTTDIKTVDYSDIENTYSVYATQFSDGNVWHTEKWAEHMGIARDSA